MIKRMMLLFVGVLALVGCQLFQDTSALQEKVMQAAKDAVVKVVYKKIEANESLNETTKEFLKEVAKNFIDSTFERLKDEYSKLTQEEIEKDLEALADKDIDNVMKSYLKASKK